MFHSFICFARFKQQKVAKTPKNTLSDLMLMIHSQNMPVIQPYGVATVSRVD